MGETWKTPTEKKKKEFCKSSTSGVLPAKCTGTGGS